MGDESKRVIDLSQFHGVGLILLVPSGVLYKTQAEGLACSHPQAEGVFVPLRVSPGAAEMHALRQHFRGGPGPINEVSADIVDGILRRNGHGHLKVNRARLEESYEAWISVLVDEESSGRYSDLGIAGFGNCEAILIWPNSD